MLTSPEISPSLRHPVVVPSPFRKQFKQPALTSPKSRPFKTSPITTAVASPFTIEEPERANSSCPTNEESPKLPPSNGTFQRNTTGLPSGVWYDRVENRYVVQCNETTACGRKKRRYFGVSRYGEENARHLAIAARLQVLGFLPADADPSAASDAVANAISVVTEAEHTDPQASAQRDYILNVLGGLESKPQQPIVVPKNGEEEMGDGMEGISDSLRASLESLLLSVAADSIAKKGTPD